MIFAKAVYRVGPSLLRQLSSGCWQDYQHGLWYPSGWGEVHAPRNYRLIAKNVVFK